MNNFPKYPSYKDSGVGEIPFLFSSSVTNQFKLRKINKNDNHMIDNIKPLVDKIKPMVAQIQALNRQAYVSYKPEVERLITHRVKDDKTIQRLLDGLLDFCGDENVLLLYKKLCRYYWDINPQATADYINIYRETWDHEN